MPLSALDQVTAHVVVTKTTLLKTRPTNLYPPSLANISSFWQQTVMSQSPSASVSNGSETTNKRRRTGGEMDHSPPPDMHQSQPAHIPKRGARACTACRKGKNRCEGEVSSVPVQTCLVRSPRPARFAFSGSLSSLSAQQYPLYL